MTKRWILIDSATGEYTETLSVTSADLATIDSWSVRKERLRGGRRDGVDTVRIDNGRIRFTVVPTRGMGLWKAWCGDLEIGWQSPVAGPVHPSMVPLFEPSGIGWLSGFDELIARCGLESNGAPQFAEDGTLQYPLHGRIQNIPAHRVELEVDPDAGELRLNGVVDEARLFGNSLRLHSTYRTGFGESSIHVIDRVENLSATPKDFELMYHINFGLPLVTPGAKVVLPVQRMSPRNADAADPARYATWNVYESPTPGIPEACYLCELAADTDGHTAVLLQDRDGARGVRLKFSKGQFPCFTLWKNPIPESDGYVTGLEPATNFPNTRDFEKSHGRVVTLAPGQSRIFEIEMEFLTDTAAVTEARNAVESLGRTVSPEFLTIPDSEWAS